MRGGTKRASYYHNGPGHAKGVGRLRTKGCRTQCTGAILELNPQFRQGQSARTIGEALAAEWLYAWRQVCVGSALGTTICRCARDSGLTNI